MPDPLSGVRIVGKKLGGEPTDIGTVPPCGSAQYGAEHVGSEHVRLIAQNLGVTRLGSLASRGEAVDRPPPKLTFPESAEYAGGQSLEGVGTEGGAIGRTGVRPELEEPLVGGGRRAGGGGMLELPEASPAVVTSSDPYSFICCSLA